MPTQVMNHTCPACGGPLHFGTDSGKLECEYCGSAFEVADIEAQYAEQEQKAEEAYAQAEEKEKTEENDAWDSSGLNGEWDEDGTGVKTYICNACGAELICDETTAATACPYCGNPVVVSGKVSGALKPDYVLPFKLDKAAAVAALKKHYHGKRLLPKAFTAENHLQEIKGLYVPFWLFDGEAEADVTYAATRTHIHRRGNMEIITTEHFQVRRAGSLAFEKVPVDGAKKMPDAYMDSLEPYDYSALKDFSTAYLPGFFADKYDVSANDSAGRADERCANSVLNTLRNTVVGYQTCMTQSQDVKLKRGKVHYALMPVWMLNTNWRGKNYLFAMNGQTGKLVGDLPISWGKFWAFFAAIAAPLSGIMALIRFVL